MKRTVSMWMMLLCYVVASAQSMTVKVTVTNDWKEDKANEPVVVKFSDMKKVNFEVKSVTVKCKGKEVPCQLDDMDGNGRPDELFFLTDIKDKETKTFEVKLSAKEQGARSKEQEGRIYTALQLRDKQDKHPDVLRVEAPGKSNIFNDIYMHGVTLESDVVGYRIYFDHRQNIDLYGKKQRRIELPVTQFYTSEEQLAQGYGVDVLWAGDAIGCGSFKDWKKGQPENWTEVGVRGQRVVTTGPLRTVVEVYDLGVREEDLIYDMRQYYTLYAGHRDMQVEVQFTPSLGKKLFEKKFFCTGVQKVGETADEATRKGHNPQGFVKKEGLAASWGCDYPDMGKKQLWAPEPVGLAVYVPKEYISDTKENNLNYLFVVQPKKNFLRYFVSFCADKEEEGFHSSKEWFASLDEWKDNVSHPVRVKVE